MMQLHPMRIKTVSFAVALLAVAVGTPGIELSSTPIDLRADPRAAREIGFYKDNDQEDTLGDVIADASRFVPFDLFNYEDERNETVVWIRVPLVNEGSERTYYLDLTKGHFWKAELYVADATGNQISYSRFSALSPERFSGERDAAVAFPFTMPANSVRTLYLRLKTYDITAVGATVRSHEGLLMRLSIDRLTTGILLGIIVGLLVYSAVIFRSLRDRSYYFYLGFLATSIPYILATRRLGTAVVHDLLGIGPLSVMALLAMVALIFVVLFTRTFLQTRETMPVIHHILTGLLIAAPVSILASWLGPAVVAGFDGWVMLATIATMLAAGIVGMLRGHANASTYAASLFVFLAGALISFLYDLGVRPNRLAFLFADAVQLGVVLCGLLLSVGLSHRVARIHAERMRLEELSRAKSDLLAAVSHELRTPLANLWLLIDRVRDGEDGDLIRRDDPVFASMGRQAERLAAHVDNLLVHSRFELLSRTPILAGHDIGKLVDDYAGEFFLRAVRAGVELRVDRPEEEIPVEVDVELFASVIGNLLDNALRATPAGGLVVVRVDRQPGRADRLRIVVEDTGPGVPNEIEPRLFEPHSGSRSNGLGLGLALARQIVELHGGSIAYEPRSGSEGSGARFTVVLPVAGELSTAHSHCGERAAEGEVQADERAARSDSDSPASIIVVDDDPDLRENLQQLLGRRFNVRSAADVDAADRLLASVGVEAIVSDVMMPGTDGFTWCARLRSNERFRAIPVLFLTARADQESELRGLELGAVDYVRKPFRPDALIAKLDSLIQTRRAVATQLRRAMIAHVTSWEGCEDYASVAPADPERGEEIDLDAARSVYGLTDRQIEVLGLVTKGYTNREIAGFLNVSVKTVNYHVSAILKRVGVDRRTQLAHELLGRE